MLKKDLVAAIQSKTADSKPAIVRTLDALAEVVRQELSKGETFELSGVGIFKVINVAARKGRNPATGEVIDIPAKRKVTFKAVKALRDVV